MADLNYNEFQRELQRYDIDPKIARMLSLIYERMVHMAGEIDATAKAVLALAGSVQGFVGLHEETQRRVNRMNSSMKALGIEVRSEPIDSGSKKN